MLLYWSEDNGQFYQAKDLDTPVPADPRTKIEGFMTYEVFDVVTFKAEQLCVVDGHIIEALLETQQARCLTPL